MYILNYWNKSWRCFISVWEWLLCGQKWLMCYQRIRHGMWMIHCLSFVWYVNVQNIVESVLPLILISLTPLLTLLIIYKIHYFVENITQFIQGYWMYEIPDNFSFCVLLLCLNRNRCPYHLYGLLTYSVVQSPSWAANWFVASQEIPRISRNPKVHYRTHSVRHLSVLWASPIQSTYQQPTSCMCRKDHPV